MPQMQRWINGLFIYLQIKVETVVDRRPSRRPRRAELPRRAPRKCAQVEPRSCLDFCRWTIPTGLCWLCRAIGIIDQREASGDCHPRLGRLVGFS